MDPAFLASLNCPYCRSALHPAHGVASAGAELVAGTVRCACYEYPVVDGILVLRQTSGPSDTADPAVAALQRGAVDDARRHLFERTSMLRAEPPPTTFAGFARAAAARLRSDLRRRVSRRGGDGEEVAATPFRSELDALRPRGFADYLYQRYANPSFVAAVPLLTLLAALEPDTRADAPVVVDLGCGVGHSTAMLRTMYPSWRRVAVEPDFVNLHLLRRHFDPDAACICADAELPLPFADDAIDAVVCLDAFHYIRSKWALVQELDRTVRDDGVWVVPHLHNAARTNPAPGIPLTAAEYVRLLGPRAVLVDETDVLEQLAADHVVDVPAPPLEALPGGAAFGLVRSARDDVWGRRDVLERLLRHAGTRQLGPNPIYEVTTSGPSLHLRRQWPDQWLERECAAIEGLQPAEVELDRSLLERAQAGAPEPGDLEELERLVATAVLVHLPAGYRSTGSVAG